MLDHCGITVANLDRCKAFYTKTLHTLGYAIVLEAEGWIGFGVDGKPDFWVHQGTAVTRSLHLAFSARTRAAVRAFHAAALEAGGEDNGGPGVREHYHANYYGAFVLDPDGRNIEAVCHAPE